MTLPTLTWNEHGQADDGRFGVQRTCYLIAGTPGTCWSLLIRHDVDRRLRDALDVVDVVSHGRGAKSRTKAAARRIARARYLLEQTAAENVGWRDQGGRRSYRLWSSETDYVTGITEDMACLRLAGLVKPWTGYGTAMRGAVEITPAGRRVLGQG